MEEVIFRKTKGQGHDRHQMMNPAVSEIIKEAPLPDGKLRVR